MADLVRRETIGRGYDPREFALFAFGGAGPLHVCAYGRDVGARAIVVPANASVFSAFGIAGADVVAIAQASDPMIAPFDARAAERDLRAASRRPRSPTSRPTASRAADATPRARDRDALPRPGPRDPRPGAARRARARASSTSCMAEFERRYTRRYGRGTVHARAGIEARTYAVRGIGRLAKPELALAAARRRRTRGARASASATSSSASAAGSRRRPSTAGSGCARQRRRGAGGDRGGHHERAVPPGQRGARRRPDQPPARAARADGADQRVLQDRRERRRRHDPLPLRARDSAPPRRTTSCTC